MLRRRISPDHRWRLPVLGVTLLATAFMLRPPLSIVGPLAELIGSGLSLTSAAVGLVTTISLLVFVTMSPLMSRFAHRWGAERVIMVGLALIVVGSLLRWIPAIPTLYLGTLVSALGIVAPNVLLSTIAQKDFPKHIGLVTALYTTMMSIGGGVASVLALPIANGLGLGWQGAFGVIAIPGIFALLFWFPFEREKHEVRILEPSPSVFKNARAWQLAVFFGAQAAIGYTVMAWFPRILTDNGLPSTVAAAYVGGFAIIGPIASILVPLASTRRASQSGVAAIAASMLLIGTTGVLLTEGHLAGLFTIVIGLGAAGCFSMSFTLVSLKTRTPREAARLSGMSQSVGYVFASIAPVLFGFIHDASDSWRPVAFILVGLATLALVAGIFAGRRGYIIDAASAPTVVS